jgi:16S rRNA (guanine1207-N2)-methyltransferase
VAAFAVDSNARAIQCVELGAELNGISGLQTQLNSDGQLGLDESIDVVLCNPPYYSDFEIADKMVRTSRQALRSGGAALFVNKQPKWYEERLPQEFDDVAIFPSAKYWVACGRKP